MREILFKAKDIKGCWHEGLLCHEENAWFISNKAGAPRAFEVMKNTISQYTGLTDKNGNKIWENNIIHIGDKAIPYIVEWHDTGFMGKAVKAMDRIGLKYWSSKIEIIGNIFDNPELLEMGR